MPSARTGEVWVFFFFKLWDTEVSACICVLLTTCNSQWNLSSLCFLWTFQRVGLWLLGGLTPHRPCVVGAPPPCVSISSSVHRMFSLALIRWFRRCGVEIQVTYNPSWIPFTSWGPRPTQPQHRVGFGWSEWCWAFCLRGRCGCLWCYGTKELHFGGG